MKTLASTLPRRLGSLALIGAACLAMNATLFADLYHPQSSPAASQNTAPSQKVTPEKPVAYESIETLRKKADKSEVMDEALGGKTLHGTPVTPRTPECFPAETRDVLWEMDMVPDQDGKLHPLNFDQDDNGKIDAKERQAIQGRNTWVFWGGGNESFWNWLAQDGYSLNDYVHFLDSRQRGTRFKRSGAINQPGYKANTDPSKRILGLYLDVVDDANPDKRWLTAPEWERTQQRVPYPTDDKHKKLIRLPAASEKPVEQIIAEQSSLFQPGDVALFKDTVAKLAAMGDGLDYTVYGFPSGVVGLRLFINPDFFGVGPAAKQARQYWNERVVKTNDRYYTDHEVFADTALVRPFRVSMSCGFCHVAPHPLSPPADRENPEWRNLSSNIGNQYWKPVTAFGNLQQPNSFLYHFLASQQPGTVDTSAISTDHINNANTINGVFEVNARFARAGRPPLPPGQTANPTEKQSAANVLVPGIEDPGLPIQGDGNDWRHTPRVLLDGSDSIGAFGALARVYLNIGTFYEQWNRCHNAVIGYTPQRPFSLATCQRNSVYWMTNEKYRVPYLAAFFTMKHEPRQEAVTAAPLGNPAAISHNSTQAMKLAHAQDATGVGPSIAADSYLKLDDSEKRKRGRSVWLNHCAICHSSKQPADFKLHFTQEDPIASWGALPAPSDNTYRLPMKASDWLDFKRSPAYAKYCEKLLQLVNAEGKGKGLNDDPLTDDHPFWKNNCLTTDIRVPITLVGTNSGRAMATNAIHNSVWDNFSSDTYKGLEAVGRVNYVHPLSGELTSYEAPGGGRGYYRPATHVSLWATAPFLHNNALGLFREDPSVAGRLVQFSDSIRRLLWNDRRGARTPVLSDSEWDWLATLPATERPFDTITSSTRTVHEGDLRGTGTSSAKNDKGFVYRVNVEQAFIEFAPSFAKPFVTGLFGPCITWVLSFGLWIVLVPFLLWLASTHRPRLVGITLISLAVLVTAGLAVSGIGGGGSTAGVILMAVSGLLELSSGEWWIIAGVLALFGAIFLQARPEDGRAARVLLGLLLAGLVYAACRAWPHVWLGVVLGLIALGLLWRLKPTLAGFAHGFFLTLALITALLGYTANRFIEGKKLLTIPILNLTINPPPLKVGPIPKGTPVNLVMNLDRDSPKFAQALIKLVVAMAEIRKFGKTGDEAYEILAQQAGQALLDASKCKDFTLDQGHLFGETLDPDPMKNDQAKEDLIAFLKTL